MTSPPFDEPEKCVLVPESLVNPVSEYVEHLRRRRRYAVDKPGGDDGPADASGADSSENTGTDGSTPGVGTR